MSDEAYHEPLNLQKAITINDTDGQSVEDDDTHYSTAGEFETVVENDTFELDDTFSRKPPKVATHRRTSISI